VTEKGEERGFDRRNFFREGLKEMFKPLAEFIADRITDMPDFSSLTGEEEEQSFFIRPPGAPGEEEFLKKCIRCGSCAVACPHGAVSLLKRDEISSTGRSVTYSWRPYKETGTPRIVPAREPCRMCEGFPCAAACPSGALEVPGEEVRIGYAVVNEDTCRRADGDDCRLCVEACPVGEKALRVRRKGVVFVTPEACNGCGFCEKVCPVEPAAIRVYPLEESA